MLNLIIILFHLKLDKFYCIGDMNWLKVIVFSTFYQKFDLFLSRKILVKKLNSLLKSKLYNSTRVMSLSYEFEL